MDYVQTSRRQGEDSQSDGNSSSFTELCPIRDDMMYPPSRINLTVASITMC